MSYKYAVEKYDDWLERWLAQSPCLTGAALDVGCGPGLDTRFLTTRGFRTHACDLSHDALVQSRTLNPAVPHAIANARDLSPYADAMFDLVVAGLSLHYFDRDDSHRAFGAVHRVLKPGGLFLFRLNAWDDYEYGAAKTFRAWQVVEEPHGVKKQFFSDAMIRELVAGRFELLSIEKQRSDRYTKPKSFFECCAKKWEKAPDPTTAAGPTVASAHCERSAENSRDAPSPHLLGFRSSAVCRADHRK